MSPQQIAEQRVFRVYNGSLIVGHVSVPATSRDALADAEREADAQFGMWDQLDEVNYTAREKASDRKEI